MKLRSTSLTLAVLSVFLLSACSLPGSGDGGDTPPSKEASNKKKKVRGRKGKKDKDKPAKNGKQEVEVVEEQTIEPTEAVWCCESDLTCASKTVETCGGAFVMQSGATQDACTAACQAGELEPAAAPTDGATDPTKPVTEPEPVLEVETSAAVWCCSNSDLTCAASTAETCEFGFILQTDGTADDCSRQCGQGVIAGPGPDDLPADAPAGEQPEATDPAPAEEPAADPAPETVPAA